MTTPHIPSTDELLREHLIRERQRAESSQKTARMVTFLIFCAFMLAVVAGVLIVVYRNASCASGWQC